jgi:shikimate kinase
MAPVFLVGYMGCGKSTVGKMLAGRLGLQFIDMDVFLENRFHKTVSQLFAERGEDGFRRMERVALEEICGYQDTVVATGGGAPCFFDNMDVMNDAGTTVYIKASVEILSQRLRHGKAKRPLVSDKTDDELKAFIDGMLLLREPYYTKARLTVHSTALLDFGFVDEIIGFLSEAVR